MTPDTSGPTSRQPLAFYDRESACWRTSQGTFPWDSMPSSVTLPRWGMTRGGELFELPTPALPTTGRECSSLPTPRATRGGSATETVALLPTARATDGTKGGPNQRGSSGDLMLPSAVMRLPTPTSSISSDGITAERAAERARGNLVESVLLLPTPVADHSRGLPQPGSDFQSLPNVALSLLPTPVVNDMGEGKTPTEWTEWTERMRGRHGNGNGHGPSLSIEAQKLLGANTKPPSAAGNTCSDDLLPPQLSLLDEEEPRA